MADDPRDYVDFEWASSGSTTKPTGTKINTGWIAEIPTYPAMNWWMRRVDGLLRLLDQNGVLRWKSLVAYAKGALTIGSDDNLYVANRVTAGEDPVGRINDYDWSEVALPSKATIWRGHFSGLLVSLDAASGGQDLDIQPGIGRDSADSMFLELTTVLTKQIDADWAEGDDAGGFPSTLTLTTDTDYYLFLIGNSTTGEVDAGVDSSVTAANLLGGSDAGGSGYDRYLMVMPIRTHTDTGIKIKPFLQDPDNPSRVIWELPVLDVDLSSAMPTTAADITSSAPPNTTAELQVSAWGDYTAGANKKIYGRVVPKSFTTPTPDKTNANVSLAEDANFGYSVSQILDVPLDGSSQCQHIWSDASGDLEIRTLGFRFSRGKP